MSKISQQVSLQSPGDVANVKNVGVAAALSTHTFMDITHIQVSNLGCFPATCPLKGGMKLLIHSQTSTAAQLKFGNG